MIGVVVETSYALSAAHWSSYEPLKSPRHLSCTRWLLATGNHAVARSKLPPGREAQFARDSNLKGDSDPVEQCPGCFFLLCPQVSNPLCLPS